MKKILDVGCGDRKKNISGSSVIGIDRFRLKGVDVVHDLDVFPYPFADNEFDEIICDDVIEHLDDVLKVMKELWRIGKPGAKMIVSTPHFSSDNYYTDPTHKHPFSSRSFNYFDPVYAKNFHQFYSNVRFKILKCVIGFSEVLPSGNTHSLNIAKILGFEWLVNRFPRIYEKFFAFMFPATELYFELRIEK
jgi:SAM-dependent methyltransferase